MGASRQLRGDERERAAVAMRPDLARSPRTGPTLQSGVNGVLALQHLAGNSAVTRLVQRASSVPGTFIDRLPVDTAVVQRSAGGLLAVGESGPAVRELQERLNATAAGPPVAVDGIFGAGTRAAVVAFQRANGLTPDGMVGPATRSAMGVRGSQRQPTGADHAALAEQITQAVGSRVGAAPGGTSVNGSATVGGTSVAGHYDSTSGAAGGSITTRQGSASGEYDPTTGVASGSGSYRGTTAAGSYDTTTGQATGSASTNTSYGPASATGSYNTSTGAGSGSVSVGGTSASGAYDPTTGQGSGSVASGGYNAAGTANVDAGTGSGSVGTPYGTASVGVDNSTVQASVDVPGYGNVSVSVDRPDWL
jgi:peptidoglycan hydrolase-like protein with peptidoglycan-binding domain